jgi:hypothetical protein
MKVGDLVRIAPWCKNKGKLAILTDKSMWTPSTVYIRYLDASVEGKGWPAIRRNLEVINESR